MHDFCKIHNILVLLAGNGTDGRVYRDITIDNKRAYDIGLFVTNVTSDMGSSNQSMWSHFGIGVNKGLEPKVFIPHPCAEDSKLYFMADVPDLIKNLKTALCKGDIKCGEKVFSIQPVKALADYDRCRDLKLASMLQLGDIKGWHFAKIKVSNAMHVFGNSVASGLSYMTDKGFLCVPLKKVGRDTAWFISTMNKWFDLMSSCLPGLAISKMNMVKYDESYQILKTSYRYCF